MALTQNAILDRAAFTEELATDAIREGNTNFIQSLLTAARTKLGSGGGEVSFLSSATGNGKSGMQECRMDAVELMTVASQALTLYAGKVAAGITAADMLPISTTYADFSGLCGC